MISPFHICNTKVKFILLITIAIFLLSVQYCLLTSKWLSLQQKRLAVACINKQHAPALDDDTIAALTQTDFQLISSKEGQKIYMYSAYYDPSVNVIKVIGGARLKYWFRSHDIVFCKYYNEIQRIISIRTGTVVRVEKSNDLPYGAAFILCELQDCEYPTFVSISVQNEPQKPDTPNLFYIQYLPTNPMPAVEFSVCVDELKLNDESLLRLIVIKKCVHCWE